MDPIAASMFLNRSTESNWMILRLLPYMRKQETVGNEDWAKKWKILDESFRFMTDGLAGLRKKIAHVRQASENQ
jgi:hypothetical protein